MADSFVQFIKNEALADEVPFGIDFAIEPPTEIGSTEDVAGFKIPKFNELLARESWFFNKLATVVSSPVTNSTLVYRRLAHALIKVLDAMDDLPIFNALLKDMYAQQELIKQSNKINPQNTQPLTTLPALETATIADIRDAISVTDASRFVTNPPQLLARSKEFLQFEQDNVADLKILIDNLKLGQSRIGVTWLKVSFFMLSRVDGKWTHSQTGCLRNSQLEEISEFINLEANKGVKLEIEPESEPSEGDEEGKEESKQPASNESTGKSKKVG